MRREYTLSFICIVLVASLRALAAEPLILPPGLDNNIDRGLFFLQKQQKADGSFDSTAPPAAMAGLGTLAFLSAGHTPDVGRYGLTVRKAVDYLVNLNPEGGYYGRDGGRMYGHFVVTLALAQAFGTETDEIQRRKVRGALEKCLKVIYAAQDAKKQSDVFVGGWRYEPDSTDSDLSATAWALATLRACNSAGLPVPKERIGRAMKFVLACHKPKTGGFAYTPDLDATASMTAAGLMNLYLSDSDERAEVAPAGRFLADNLLKEDARHYYAAMQMTTHAAFVVGQAVFDPVWKNNSAQLLRLQNREDGSWPERAPEAAGGDRKGRLYSTAMAVMTLSIPLRLLPMYQR